MKINIKIVEDFEKVQDQLPLVLKGYGMSHAAVYRHAKIKKTTYFKKLKDKSFTAAEMKDIANFINR